MSQIPLDLALAPGFLPAARAVHALLEGAMPADDVDRIVAVALGVARPYIQAEMLADLSDDFADNGLDGTADLLDMISLEIRERLDGRR